MKTLSIILFIFLSTVLSSQTWTNYDLKDLNLEYLDLYDLELDSFQNLWVASLSGLLKFDGNDWSLYDTSNSNIPSNLIFTVGIDNNDIIWIGYENDLDEEGIGVFDGKNWKTYHSKNSDFNPFSVSDIVFDNNNNPWFATWNFLWSFKNNQWLQYTFNSNDFEVYEIEVDKNNSIWFTTGFDGLFKYFNGNFENYIHINRYSYNGLAIDSNNNIWIVNNQNSLMHLNIVSKEWIVRDTMETPISYGFNIPHTIIVDKNNTLWITDKRNLHNFNPETELWKTYTAPDSLYPTEETFSFRDFKLEANGNFWFITAGAGVFKLSDVITDVEVEPFINGISIYPNPSNSFLTYETNNITSIIQHSIVDLSGKVLINDNVDNAMRNSINVSKLQSGVYFLQLTDMKGVKYSKKFVIE